MDAPAPLQPLEAPRMLSVVNHDSSPNDPVQDSPRTLEHASLSHAPLGTERPVSCEAAMEHGANRAELNTEAQYSGTNVAHARHESAPFPIAITMSPSPDLGVSQAYPLRTGPRPLLQRLSYRSRAFIHRQNGTRPLFTVTDAEISAPTFIKVYDTCPGLPVAVYIPPPDASKPGPLPLYIHVAPTSFLRPTLPPPALSKKHKRGSKASKTRRSKSITMADLLSSRLSRQHGICVACVGFRSPPRWLFPTQVWDVVGLVEEIVAGTGLPIDRGRVAVGGIGAGGNVALGAVQAIELQGMVKAVAAIAPIVDWSIPFGGKVTQDTTLKLSDTTTTTARTIDIETEQLAGENDAESSAAATTEEIAKKTVKQKPNEKQKDKETRRAAKRARKLDAAQGTKKHHPQQDYHHMNGNERKQNGLIAELYDLMDWSYVPPRHDRADAMLSPAYAASDKFPPNMFLAGIMGDVLCPEAERLALRVAAERDYGGTSACTSWERAGVRWETLEGWPRNFFEAFQKTGKEQAQQESLESLVDELGEWLWRTAYA